MNEKVHEILLVLDVSKEVMRSCPEVFTKLERLLAEELLQLPCQTIITPDRLKSLEDLVRKE